jgi:transcriptional regulator GlxA family with amidase domain
MTPTQHVSLVAIADCVISTLHGIYDVLNAVALLHARDGAGERDPPFHVEIVGMSAGPVGLASGLSATAHRGFREVDSTDIVIVPSVLLGEEGWRTGRYAELVAWLSEAHRRGALICSACSGVFLIAETGLLDGVQTTVHWNYAACFRRLYPAVPLCPDKALVIAGARSELISSGASTSWHDLVLYLIARHAGPTAAQTVAKFFALQWHHEGLKPYIVFQARLDHGDGAIREAQLWLSTHFPVANPVEEAVRRSGLSDRTFKRRFSQATGYAPLAYVQQLRIEDAKRRLERTRDPVDDIGWRVGYEDPAFFRRLFKRLTGLAPGSYRRQFQIPGYDPNGKETSAAR